MVPDALYDAAVALVRMFDKASASFLQRKLKINFDRAADLLLSMEHGGVVTARDSRNLRQVVDPFIKGGVEPEPSVELPAGMDFRFVPLAEHDRRVSELLAANNAEVIRRRNLTATLRNVEAYMLKLEGQGEGGIAEFEVLMDEVQRALAIELIGQRIEMPRDEAR